MLAEALGRLFQYAPLGGHKGDVLLREQLRIFHGADPQAIFVGNGSLQALDLLCAELRPAGPFDVLVESPCYDRALGIFQRHGARLLGVPLQADGLDMSTWRRCWPGTARACSTPSPISRTPAASRWARPSGIACWRWRASTASSWSRTCPIARGGRIYRDVAARQDARDELSSQGWAQRLPWHADCAYRPLTESGLRPGFADGSPAPRWLVFCVVHDEPAVPLTLVPAAGVIARLAPQHRDALMRPEFDIASPHSFGPPQRSQALPLLLPDGRGGHLVRLNERGCTGRTACARDGAVRSAAGATGPAAHRAARRRHDRAGQLAHLSHAQHLHAALAWPRPLAGARLRGAARGPRPAAVEGHGTDMAMRGAPNPPLLRELDNPGREEFLACACAGRPALIHAVVPSWPCSGLWSIDYLRQRLRGRKGQDGAEFASHVDPEHPDLARHPLFARACCELDFRLEAGQMLNLPPFWWHSIRALGNASISINTWYDTACGEPRQPLQLARELLRLPLAQIQALPPAQQELARLNLRHAARRRVL